MAWAAALPDGVEQQALQGDQLQAVAGYIGQMPDLQHHWPGLSQVALLLTKQQTEMELSA